MNKLTHWIADKSYQTNSDFIVAVFNGLLTLPTAQRNEVWGRVTGKYSLEELSSIKKTADYLIASHLYRTWYQLFSRAFFSTAHSFFLIFYPCWFVLSLSESIIRIIRTENNFLSDYFSICLMPSSRISI